jgi:hypothetical protein
MSSFFCATASMHDFHAFFTIFCLLWRPVEVELLKIKTGEFE